MSKTTAPGLPDVLARHEQELLDDWLHEQFAAATLRPELMSEEELRQQSREFLSLLRQAVADGIPDDIHDPRGEAVLGMLRELTRNRVARGFTVSEIAAFVFSLKQPLFRRLAEEFSGDPKVLVELIWETNVYLDRLGLYTTEVYHKSREQVIARQQAELLELSTPVVQLWEGVLAIPLIGTLDSARTQVVMESLLQRMVDTGATIAIIDITGVPTVDTNVAKHLIKTVTAARLMGADCFISGIRPAIAQTIVHLGVNLSEIVTKATLADALALALRKAGFRITRTEKP